MFVATSIGTSIKAPFAPAGLPCISLPALPQPGFCGGLLLGKLARMVAPFASPYHLGLSAMPTGAVWAQLLGVLLLCSNGVIVSLLTDVMDLADTLQENRATVASPIRRLLAGLMV